MTPDVNILLAASRSDHPHHDDAMAWLHEALSACETGGTLELLPMVGAGFMRIVTNAKVFPQPTPVREAIKFLKAILSVPGAVMPQIGPEWNGFEKMCADRGLAGNRIPDAWIAAAVNFGGFHLVTFDRGFRDLLHASQFTLIKTK